MIKYTNIEHPNNSMGRPCVPVDGDTAAQEERTVSRLEVYSINTMKSPGGVTIGGCSTLQVSKTLLAVDAIPIASSSSAVDPELNNREHRTRSQQDMQLTCSQISSKKRKIWSGINRKFGITIATLNIKGRNRDNRKSKWPMITTMMRENRILILALQETHLDDNETEIIGQMCPKIEIINNGISKNKEGVAFVINKELANNMTWKHTILMEGRVSRLTIRVEEDRGLDIINVYAPNEDSKKIKFFEELKEMLKHQEMENVIIMGDFNFVENELDRFPHRKDDNKVSEAWNRIKTKHKLIDGWRMHNELKKQFTFIQPVTNSMSRIDRIYVNDEIYPYGYNWSHIDSAQLSDHDVAKVDILKQKLPYIGNGIWRMQPEDMENEKVRALTDELLDRTEKEMIRIKKKRENGTQELWATTKEEIKKIIESPRKQKNNQLNKKKRKLSKRLKERLSQLNNETKQMNEKNQKEISELKAKIAQRSKSEMTRLQEATRARYRNKGEKYTKYWFGLNKKKSESQVILALQKPDGTLTTQTRDMLEIALKHHEELQKEPEMTNERIRAIEEMKKTSTTKTSEKQKTDLKKRTSYEEIEKSLKRAPNGSAPGIDGIIYEFYKDKLKNHEEDNDKPDIVGILHLLIEDIEKNGIVKLKKDDNKKDEFTDGIMHLLFKKKEKWKIENYRPITLLNTDYKTYTKTIAMRLAEVAKSMIHEDQAGFVPERSLYDHTKTTNLAIEYCELMDKNGCIIALDQEKAYDKIDHEYLWKILEHYEFPKVFIDRIKELYKDTGKAIIVNGKKTRQYKVKRGVHQGNPMSCLLYDFAIEPLADAVRKSKLKGIEINGNVKRLIISLFADDTLIYMAANDDLNELKEVIKRFCLASTARFNMEKTEYLPIGNKTFRQNVINTRRIGNNDIEQGVKIIKEGEAMRTLGAWVGNETNTEMQWNEILRKQEDVIKAWSKTNMSLKGKELILKALIQSKAMFMATVNGMPNVVEEKMKKLFKDFLWDNKKRGLMGWNQIIAPREQGGLAIPDIRSRIEAIEIMWIKKWLSPNIRKPKWTYILDEIINLNIAKAPMIDPESRINWLKQSWHESEATNSKLSKGVKNMLKIVRKHNVTLEPLKYSRETKGAEPLWHNRLMTNANYLWNKKSTRCIRINHKITTIEELHGDNARPECNDEKACESMTKKLIDMIPDIINPVMETPNKIRVKNLDLTPRRIKENEENDNYKTFNPDITARGNVLEQVRILGTTIGTKKRGRRITPKPPAYRKIEQQKEGKTKIKIVTLVQNKGKKDESIKVNITMKGDSNERTEFMLRKEGQSQDKANAMALLWILKKNKSDKLKIIINNHHLVKWIGDGLSEAENNDWLNCKEPTLWKAVLNGLRRRNSKIVIKTPNEKEEKKMEEIKEKLRELNLKRTRVNIKSIEKYLHKGAKLSNLTQKTAYELILRKKSEKPGGPETWRRMKQIKKNLENKWNIRIEEEKIWKELENIKNNKIQDFMWKMIHNKVRCGKFFAHIPNWQDKQFCTCGEVKVLNTSS